MQFDGARDVNGTRESFRVYSHVRYIC